MSPVEEPDVDPKEVEEILAKEMSALSFQERGLIQEEIHGVANVCPDETPAMMEEALAQMQQTLDSIPNKPDFYNRISASSYIHSTAFRLRFLRCELYDARKAAARLLRFVEYIKEHYDTEVLERPLQMSDLQMNKQVMDCFRSGEVQLLPFRDRSGRRIMVTKASTLRHKAVIRVS